MEKKYIERLEQVIRVLEELPREKKFNLRSFMTCGTTACACGWAGADPWFRRRGFKTEKYHSHVGSTLYNVSYQEFGGMDAVRKFFGLDFATSYHLFIKDLFQDNSKRAVIRRLRRFLKGTSHV